jgi:hypothetical protein
LLDDVKRDVQHYMNEFGLNYEDYIDKDEFITGLIDSDGYGMVASYDGEVSEYYIKDETFYVVRLN